MLPLPVLVALNVPIVLLLPSSVPPTDVVVSELALRNAPPLSAIVVAEVSTKLSFTVFAFSPPVLSI